MNEKPMNEMNNDELALHIARLESQPWVAALQDLQPQSSARGLFELGFAAGEQAQTEQTQAARLELPRHREIVGRWTWAAISSAVSIAATVMIMIPMVPVVERSSGQQHIAESAPSLLEDAQPQAKPASVREIASQSAALDLEGALAELERRSGIEGTTIPAGLVDAKPTIARESMRYVTQRRAWISELSSELQ